MEVVETTVATSDSETLRVAGDSVRVLAAAASTENRYEAFEISALENSGPPPHTHAWRELYYVMSGEIELSVNSTTMRLGAGSVSYIPEGAVHTHRIASPNARYVLVADPGGVAACFREIDQETHGSIDDLPKILSIAQRHGFDIKLG
jgi:quercetin dioxygenase-like cupin family protein